MLRMHLTGPKFEEAIEALTGGAPRADQHVPWVVFPHQDAEMLAEEFAEVFAYRRDAGMLV